MTRWKVLLSAPRAVQALERFRAALHPAGCDVVACQPVERLTESQLLPVVSNIDAMICGDDQVTTRVLDAAPSLRIICKWGTGMDSIDVAAARSRGIVVRNTPGAFTEPVADTVLGYLLLFARQFDQMAADMREGHWQRRELVTLGECKLGIVGLGTIGKAVARRAAAFGMRTLAVSLGQEESREDPCVPRPEAVSLNTLLATCDFVTLHTDMRPGNRHLIGAAELALMKPSAILVNTSRGALVDEQALACALREGRLAGAALDVFEVEPLAEDSPLRSMTNVYLAPHNANSSPTAAERVHANCIDYVLETLCSTKQR